MGHAGHVVEDTARSDAREPRLRLGFITLLPDPVEAYLAASVLGRAREAGVLEIAFETPRDFAYDAHRKVDDTPYGGEAGMLLKAEPLRLALGALIGSEVGGREDLPVGTSVIVTEPAGDPFDAAAAFRLSRSERVIFVCGRYEGIDHRFEEAFATDVFSLGDFVLTGGELPALAMADAIARQVPGVLGAAESLASDSFVAGQGVSAPNYTRPPVWRGRAVPPVLLSGDHAAIARWRAEQAAARTARRTSRSDESVP